MERLNFPGIGNGRQIQSPVPVKQKMHVAGEPGQLFITQRQPKLGRRLSQAADRLRPGANHISFGPAVHCHDPPNEN